MASDKKNTLQFEHGSNIVNGYDTFLTWYDTNVNIFTIMGYVWPYANYWPQNRGDAVVITKRWRQCKEHGQYWAGLTSSQHHIFIVSNVVTQRVLYVYQYWIHGVLLTVCANIICLDNARWETSEKGQRAYWCHLFNHGREFLLQEIIVLFQNADNFKHATSAWDSCPSICFHEVDCLWEETM